MDTVETVKQARDEIQTLVDGSSSKLAADVTRWILNDMKQSSEYDMPMQLAARDYPDLKRALDDAMRGFKMWGLLPDVKTIGGRLFVEKILIVSLRRLNGILYTLGEQETPYGDELEKARKQLAALKVKQKLIPSLSPLALSVGKSLASIWAKGNLKTQFEAELRSSDIRTDEGLYFARSAFDELITAGAIQASAKSPGRVSVTLLPQLRAL